MRHIIAYPKLDFSKAYNVFKRQSNLKNSFKTANFRLFIAKMPFWASGGNYLIFNPRVTGNMAEAIWYTHRTL